MRGITLFLTMLLTLLSAQTTQAAQPKIYTMFDPEFGELTYYYNINYAENVSTPYIELYDPVGNPHAVRFTSYYNKVVKVVIDPSMKDAPLTSMFYMFFGGYNSKTEQSQNLSSLRKIQGLENLNTAGVTDMSYVFYRCSSLESLDLSSFNTSNVETMKFMFGGCYALKSVDVSSFSTLKVKDISSMFHSCRRIETLDLTSFITTSVTDMRAAFQGCSALTTIWCDDDWSGTSAQSSYLFSGCSNLVGGQGTTFNREIIDATYARPDGGEEEPGYFTIKGGVYPIKRKVYTEFVEETGTMTYYYDELRDSRTGVTELYDPIKYPEAVRFASYYDKVTKVVIDPSMKQAPLTSFRNMSYGGMDSETFTMYVLSNVTSIEGLENLNTEIVTDMNSMFIMYTKLETLDLSSFNTSNVTNMNGMFLGCNKLQTLDLTSFDVSNVEDMRMMFGSCYELTTIYCEQDWSEIVPPNNELEDMDNMYVMFSGCKKLVGGRGTKFDSNKINGTYARPDGGTYDRGYFTKKEVYTEFVGGTQTLTYYYDNKYASREGETEFYDPIGNPDAARFVGYNKWVYKAVIDPSMKEAPLTSMRHMFFGNEYIGQDPDNPIDMLIYLPSLRTIEGLENLNTAIVTDMCGMFYNCYRLESLDLSSFNTSNVKTMEEMFFECKSLTSLDLSSFNTSNVENMELMFCDCLELQTVDVTSFKIYKVENMMGMFNNCPKLTTIYCYADWSWSNNNMSDGMFDGCYALVGGKGTRYDEAHTDAAYARPDGGEASPGYFTEGLVIQGDLNGDKKVDIADAVTVLDIMAIGEYTVAADLNEDEKVDIADFVTVLDIMAQQ